MNEAIEPAKVTVATTMGPIIVSELRALDAMKFIRLLAQHAGKLGDNQGNIKLRLDKLVELVAGTEELARHLCLASTGKDEAWLNTLSFGEMVDVLDAAVTLNFSELNAKKVIQLGGKLKAAFGLGTLNPASGKT